MATTYGNTWWGKKWLQSLQNIDDSNRLPRGRTYANNGSVKEILIEGNQINAKVKGSQPRPYKQVIDFQKFSKEEKDLIINLVSENPFYLSKLLSRDLPEDLFDELASNQIKIFPKNWQDLRAKCSCPDWAVPCKHLAAVLYITANEIDKNPFLIFQTKGLDIIAELQKRGFAESGQIKSATPKLSDLLLKELPAKKYEFSPEIYEKIDFSPIQPARETLLKLVDNSPVFYPQKDFKLILEKALQNLSKNLTKNLAPELPLKNSKIRPEIDNIRIFVDENFKYRYTRLLVGKTAETLDTKQNIQDLIQNLQLIPFAQLLNYPPSVVACFVAFQMANFLATRGAIVPQVLELQPDKHIVRWLPALLIKEVAQAFDLFKEILPPKTLVVFNRKENFVLSTDEQAKSLLSLFLNELVGQYAQSDLADAIGRAFFKNTLLNTDKFEDKERPHSIQQWLQKYYLAHKDYVPLLKIEERESQGDFILDFWLENKVSEIEPYIPLKDLFSKKQFDRLRLEILQDFSLLSQYLPEAQKIIQSKGEKKIWVDANDLVKILFETLPALKLLGINVLLPKSLQRLARPQVSARLKTKGSSGANRSFVNLDNLLSFDWQVAMGEDMISAQEFQKIAKGLKGLVKINDQYVYFDQKEVESLLKKLEKPPLNSPADLLKAGLAEDYEGLKVELDQKARELINSLLENEKVTLPQGLNAQLRPYQSRGYEWLYKNAQLGFGSLLADDMGLGKTLQVITFLLKLKEEGELAKKKALMVVPTTLLGNWQKEIQKFAPSLQAQIYHGTNRKLDIENHDLILTTYGLVRSDADIFSRIKWAMLGIDEAQNIKNVQTEQTKAVKKLKADRVLAMSGTPVENRLSEYWSIFDFVNKGYLGSLNHFLEDYIKPIENTRDHDKLNSFKKITSPFILRRVKTDKSIIQDLPDKVENNQFCTLTAEQSALYQNVVDMIFKELQSAEGIQRKGLVLQMINALKQICNHPAHYLKKDQIDPNLSGKTGLLLDLLDSILEANEKVLIFTQYKEMGDLLSKLILEKYHFEPLWLHGGTSRPKRDEFVDTFQNKTHPKVMLLSLKAGGTGLNLTEANHVIHYDLWWNPAVESQATDRAFRIGQKKNVMVYRFITQGTFEEKINAMIQSKRELANLAVASGEQWIGDMSNEELKEVFRLG
ncbi:MAG: DEAD/DEAH box helicase [Microscillaceae bacterium]|jgi:SNF2 family DNA or RNA helicase/uncharacterized Zn finger protein|nr:DEAD/DEAH box helicase [Microscillaceae bacterium]